VTTLDQPVDLLKPPVSEISTLPPKGGDPEAIAEYVDKLVRESGNDQRRIDFISQADRAIDLYEGNHFLSADPGDVKRIVLNRIQNVVISLVAIQAGDKPQITFTPRETGEPPLYFLNEQLPEAQQFIGGMIDPTTGIPPDLTQPLDPQAALVIKQQVEASRIQAMQAAAVGMPAPPALPENLIIEVTDATAARALQTIFDGLWEECDAARIFAENVHCKNIFGWQPTLFEWDDDCQCPILTNVNPRQVFPDPLNTDVSRWHYVVYDQAISRDQALTLWPQYAKEIGDASNTQVVMPGTRSYDPAMMYDQQFEREMVTLRTAWIRFQPYPMSEREAVGRGIVVQTAVGQAAPASSVGADAGASAGDATEGDTGRGGMEAGDSGESGSGGNHGVVSLASPEAAAAANVLPDVDGGTVQGGGLAYILAATGQPVEVNGRGWPMRAGIRQLTIIANRCVDDAECEWPLPPLPCNRNVPIMFSPYGQGEPKRLESIQLAINRLLTSFVTHHAYNAYQPEFIAQGVVDRMDSAMKKARTKPGQRVVIPDDLLMQFGDIKKLIGSIDVASMPADFWQLLNLLIELIDSEGNQADVIQGNAPSGASGEYVKSLQSAASQIIRGKSMFTEFWLKNLVRLFEHGITHRMTPHDWQGYLGKYPYQAIQALHDRNKRLYRDVSVTISAASGASDQQKTQQMIAGKQMGLPVSDPTLMEHLDLDPDAEVNRQMDFIKKSQALNPTANNAMTAAGPAAPNGGARPAAQTPAA
jgi:hypothetical protein